MEWIGLIALVILLCYSSYPSKVNRLEVAMKRLERKEKGEAAMSKLIEDLIHRRCKIKSEAFFQFTSSEELICNILDADDEWIKIEYEEKKTKNKIVKLLRIENIDEVQVLEEE